MEIQFSHRNKLIHFFPFLNNAPCEILEAINDNCYVQKIPTGQIILEEGNQCRYLTLPLKGIIRVYKISENGREITLYRFGKGESCILALSCILSQNPFPANAVVDKSVEVVYIPSDTFREWIDRYAIWRGFVCNILSQRITEIISTVEEIAFKKMDIRIADFLIKKSQEHIGAIPTTHQYIANELGTAREVVSRILKDFEMENLISLSRGEIKIRSHKALTKKIKFF